MSYPYMNPQSIILTGIANFAANLTATPIFTPVNKITITGFSVVTDGAVTPVEALTNINAYLINMAAPTAQLAFINVNTTCAMTANAALQANIVTSTVAAGTRLAVYMTAANAANAAGTWGTHGCYQLDYIQGSPASEG